jgi:putative ABC transport system permease protein
MVPVSYNVRSLWARKTTTVATALGIALVVFVLAASLMLSAGIRRTMSNSGRASNALVMKPGCEVELASGFWIKLVDLILAAPGTKQDATGKPLGVGEIVVVITLQKLGTDGQVSNVQMRGVPDNVFAVRPEVSIIEGRPPTPGTDEVIVGQGVRGRFRGLDLGGQFELARNRLATVVGVFEADGSSFESEIWADRDAVSTAFGRQASVSTVTVQLQSPTKFEVFKAAIENNQQIMLEAIRESAYYEKQSEGTAVFVRALGVAIAIIFSVGAMIGASITMYAAVAQRQREIGTLRALGFSRLSILVSFLLEAFVLALGGGALGVLASLVLGRVRFSMMNFATWQEVSFSFEPHVSILLTALVAGGIMGVLGGFFPAVRAARTSLIDAMRG